MNKKQFIKVVPKTRRLYVYKITNPKVTGSYIGSTVCNTKNGYPLSKRKQLHYDESVKYPNRKLYKECGNIRECVFEIVETVDLPLYKFRLRDIY